MFDECQDIPILCKCIQL